MKTVSIDINDLIPDPRNARTHSRANVEALKASLLKFGQQKPIVINSENMIVAGNSTVSSARELGWQQISAVVTDLTEDALRAYSIADNKTCELSDWDYVTLVEILEELRDDDVDIEVTGFSVDDIETYKGVDDWESVPKDPLSTDSLTSKKILIEGNTKMFFESTLKKLQHEKGIQFKAEDALSEICSDYINFYISSEDPEVIDETEEEKS
jgi:hypothetical protein